MFFDGMAKLFGKRHEENILCDWSLGKGEYIDPARNFGQPSWRSLLHFGVPQRHFRKAKRLVR